MGITFTGWFGIIVGIIILVVGIVLAKKTKDWKYALTGIVLAALLIGGVLFYSSTAKGKRAYKDQVSNISDGISRTVTLYSINGDILEQYTGKFDVETDNQSYILFDDENGKRHIIYFSTGIVTINENQELNRQGS